MPDRKTLGETELKALVAREISLAEDGRTEASKKQTTALEYFQGIMSDVPPESGRSKMISRDVADTIGWMLPGIIRVFTSSEHMAVAEPVGREDMQWAAQATDGINYVFWKENKGYRIVYNATWDSLLSGNGVVKTWWDDTPRHEVSFHSGLTDDGLADLIGDDSVEVLAHSETPSEAGPLHEVKIRRLVAAGQTRIEAIPPEDYGKDADSKTCEDARFQYHRSEKTRSDLIEMGFDRDKVEKLDKSKSDDPEELARDASDKDSGVDASMQIIDLYECYIRVDVDGDGIAETCRVMYAGSKSGGDILDWEEWEDETPFDDIPCNPMPHRWEAQSIADETMDVQRGKTVMLRQGFDNTYATNNPQRLVKGTISNPEALFDPGFGSVVFGGADAEVVPLTVPFVANHAYDAINYLDQVIERRTGVSRQTMALDPEALQNQTATANQNAKDAAYSQIELIARNQAELGWKNVFRKINRLEIKHQDKPRTIRMRGKALDIDPRHWNADMDITINVGLGTGSRDRDLAMLQTVKADQIGLAERFVAAGFPKKALEMLPLILTSMNKSAEAAGIKSPEMFFPQVSDEELREAAAKMDEMAARGDPKVEAEKAKAAAQMQIDQALGAQKLQSEQAINAQKLKMEAVRGEQELMLRREQLAAEMALKREQLAAEMQLKRELAMAEMQMKSELGFLGVQAKAMGGTSAVHMGGEPG